MTTPISLCRFQGRFVRCEFPLNCRSCTPVPPPRCPPPTVGRPHDPRHPGKRRVAERCDRRAGALGRPGFALTVSAHEGVVTLAGSVDDEVDVAAAQDIAENVPGVTEVAVEIALRRQRDEAG